MLKGDRVRIVARSIDAARLSQQERSGRHKRQFTVARDTVECTIEIPVKWKVDQKD
jgi:hypothetical protein